MVQSDNHRATTMRRYSAERTDAKDPLLHFFIERYKQAYVDELNEFIDVVENKAKPSVGLEDGRRALIIADAAWEATRTGRAVKISYG